MHETNRSGAHLPWWARLLRSMACNWQWVVIGGLIGLSTAATISLLILVMVISL